MLLKDCISPVQRSVSKSKNPNSKNLKIQMVLTSHNDDSTHGALRCRRRCRWNVLKRANVEMRSLQRRNRLGHPYRHRRQHVWVTCMDVPVFLLTASTRAFHWYTAHTRWMYIRRSTRMSIRISVHRHRHRRSRQRRAAKRNRRRKARRLIPAASRSSNVIAWMEGKVDRWVGEGVGGCRDAGMQEGSR